LGATNFDLPKTKTAGDLFGFFSVFSEVSGEATEAGMLGLPMLWPFDRNLKPFFRIGPRVAT